MVPHAVCDLAQGMELLWKIVMDAVDSEVVARCAPFLISLYLKLGPSLLGSLAEIRAGFISHCFDNLTIAKQEKNVTHMRRVLHLLQSMLNATEVSGTGSIPSHRQLSRGATVTVTATNNTGVSDTPPLLTLSTHANASLWELRELLARQLRLRVDQVLVRAARGGSSSLSDIPDADNWKTLDELGLGKVAVITVMKRSPAPPNKVPLLTPDNKLTPKAEAVFRALFKQWAGRTGRMSCHDLAAFMTEAVGSPIYYYDSQVTTLLTHYGRLDRCIGVDDFLDYYQRASLEKPATVWNNLKMLRYRDDLLTESEAARLPAAVTVNEQLPRNIIAAHPEFYDVLFDILSVGGDVTRDVWHILNRLPTDEAIRVGVESLSVAREANPVWSKLLDYSTPLRMLYALNIVEHFAGVDRSTDPAEEVSPGAGSADAGASGEGQSESKSGVEVSAPSPTAAAIAAATAASMSDGGAGGDDGGFGAVSSGPAPSAPSAPAPPVIPPAKLQRMRELEELNQWRRDFVVLGGFQHLLACVLSGSLGITPKTPDSPGTGSNDKLFDLVVDPINGLKKLCLASLLKLVRFFVLGALAEQKPTVFASVKLSRQASSGSMALLAGSDEVSTPTTAAVPAPESMSPLPPPPLASSTSSVSSTSDAGASLHTHRLRRQLSESSLLSSTVVSGVDFARLQDRLLALIGQAATGAVSDEDCKIAEYALGLWLGCILDNRMLSGFASWPGKDKFVLQVLLCPGDNAAAIRKEFAFTLHQIFRADRLGADDVSSLRDHFVALFLESMPSDSSSTSCVQFFELLSKLLHDTARLTDSRSLFTKFSALFQNLIVRLRERPPSEVDGGSGTDDEMLIGVIMLLSSLVAIVPELKDAKHHSGRNLLLDVFEDCLFSRPDDVTGAIKCRRPASRQAAFDLLCNLCEGNAENMHLLIEHCLMPLQRKVSKVGVALIVLRALPHPCVCGGWCCRRICGATRPQTTPARLLDTLASRTLPTSAT